MRMYSVFLVIAALLVSSRVSAQTPDIKYVNEIFYPATALLYSQDEQGGMRMRCTATAIEKDETGYVFVTAAHCGAQDNTDQKTVSPEKTFFYITSDESSDKTFLVADPIGAGYRHRGDDFMLFHVKTNKQFPLVKLGEDPKALEAVVNIASPLGLGKQVFLGIISSATLHRPIVEGDINWTDAVTVQLFGTDGGSSGSALVCLDQKAICAFVVGSVGGTTMVAMPVSRLKVVIAGLKDKSYHYWKKDSDARDTKPEAAAVPKRKVE